MAILSSERDLAAAGAPPTLAPAYSKVFRQVKYTTTSDETAGDIIWVGEVIPGKFWVTSFFLWCAQLDTTAATLDVGLYDGSDGTGATAYNLDGYIDGQSAAAAIRLDISDLVGQVVATSTTSRVGIEIQTLTALTADVDIYCLVEGYIYE